MSLKNNRSFVSDNHQPTMAIQPQDSLNNYRDYNGSLRKIEYYFGNRMYISLSEAAVLMNINTKTLRVHADLGNIAFSRQGFGRKKIRRYFTVRDVARFCSLLARGATKSGSPRRKGKRYAGRRSALC